MFFLFSVKFHLKNCSLYCRGKVGENESNILNHILFVLCGVSNFKMRNCEIKSLLK